MAFYKKKPARIEAVQYLGFSNLDEVREFMGDEFDYVLLKPATEGLIINTRDGERTAKPLYYIVKTDMRDFEVYDKEFFESWYEKV